MISKHHKDEVYKVLLTIVFYKVNVKSILWRLCVEWEQRIK